MAEVEVEVDVEGRRDDACAPSPPPLHLVRPTSSGVWASNVVRWRGQEVGEQGDVEFDDELEARRDGAHASSPWVACIPKKILSTYSTPSAVFNPTIRSPLVALRMLVCDMIDNVVLVTYQAALR